MDNREEQPKEGVFEKAKRLYNSVGMGMTRERKNELYYGKPPKGVYPTNKDSTHVHDFYFPVKNLYGLSPEEERAVGALHSDSKTDWVQELVKSGVDRREAEQIIRSLIARGAVEEINHPDLGKVLVWRRGR